MLRYLQDLTSLVSLGFLAFNASPDAETLGLGVPAFRPPSVLQPVTGGPLDESRYTFQMLYAFTGGTDGAGPGGDLIADANGALYGTVGSGGGHGGGQGCGLSGCGAVFKLTPGPSGYTESILYGFYGSDYNDGDGPSSGVIADKSGALYGTTLLGGSAGIGTVFKLTPTPSGYTETVLYSFQGGSDGSDPEAGLIADASGALYGTTFLGGSTSCAPLTCGTVFKLTPTASGYQESILHSFQWGNDGFNPYGGLIIDKSGALYGTTSHGGSANIHCGTVFRLVPRKASSADGSSYSKETLYAFGGGQDGCNPVATLVADKHGTLYGTTGSGGGTICGSGTGCGTAFKLTPTGRGYAESILYRFAPPTKTDDGWYPESKLTLRDGTLYGTTLAGGQSGYHGYGTVYKLTPTRSGYRESIIHVFHYTADGAYPQAGLLADGGLLFGSAPVGGGGGGTTCGARGLYGCGVIFKLTPR
jgi:uncharacterized repeat protein (TIGR03803 family)